MNKLHVPTVKILLVLCIVLISHGALAHQLGEAVDGYKVGDKPPYWRLQFIDKNGFDFNKSTGKEYVIMFFWSRYFKHFDDTLAFGHNLYLQYKDRNLRWLGVNLDSDRKKMEKILEEYHIDFLHTWNPFLTFPDRLLATASPTAGSVIIFDKNRQIALIWQLSTNEDYKEIQDFLNRNLAP